MEYIAESNAINIENFINNSFKDKEDINNVWKEFLNCKEFILIKKIHKIFSIQQIKAINNYIKNNGLKIFENGIIYDNIGDKDLIFFRKNKNNSIIYKCKNDYDKFKHIKMSINSYSKKEFKKNYKHYLSHYRYFPKILIKLNDKLINGNILYFNKLNFNIDNKSYIVYVFCEDDDKIAIYINYNNKNIFIKDLIYECIKFIYNYYNEKINIIKGIEPYNYFKN